MKFKNPFKKPSDSDKVLSEIESIEFKKNSIISAMSSAENEFERQKIKCFSQIGEYVYRCHIDGNDNYNLDEFFQTITEKEQVLSDQKAKVCELSSQYDDEISLLSVNLNVLKTQSTAIMIDATSVSNFCPDCGNTISNGDAFCQKCGKKI